MNAHALGHQSIVPPILKRIKEIIEKEEKGKWVKILSEEFPEHKETIKMFNVVIGIFKVVKAGQIQWENELGHYVPIECEYSDDQSGEAKKEV